MLKYTMSSNFPSSVGMGPVSSLPSIEIELISVNMPKPSGMAPFRKLFARFSVSAIENVRRACQRANIFGSCNDKET
jgi:hypothetical protein